MGAPRQHAEDILGADDCQQVGLEVAVQGGEEDEAAGLYEAGAGRDHGRRLGYVFEHLHAGDHIEPGRTLRGQVLHRDSTIAHLDTGLQGVQLRDLQRPLPHVDAGDPRPAHGHTLGQNAAAAPDIQDFLAGEPRRPVDVVQPQGIDVMQGLELTVGIPPTAGQFLELADLGVIDIGGCLGHGMHPR